MRPPLQNRRLQIQLLFSVIAALSVTALSILLILEAVRTAEHMVVADARHTIDRALEQLVGRYGDRVGADPSWPALPGEAQELSLGSLARVVLASYPDVEGGFHSSAFGRRDVSNPRVAAALRSLSANSHATSGIVVPDGKDLLVIEARPIDASDVTVWASKRLAGRNDPSGRQRLGLLVVLALCGLVSVGIVLATGARLRQGIREIQRGLLVLEQDFCHLLPERDDELGEISGSINLMAAARRSLEAEVAREQRLRSIGKLVAGVAHEIRNPLNSIRLAMEMLETRLAGNTLRREDLRMVRSEVDRLNHLLTDLLTFGQAREPRGERQAVWPVIRDCLDLLTPQAHERGIRLFLAGEDCSPEAVFDEQRLKQAVLNLVLNAIQASPHGTAVRVAIAADSGGVRVAVHDEGPGLTTDQREHLFEAFYSTKPKGTGLGLAVSRELIAGMGGDLTYEPGRPGATFLICLPAGVTQHA